jgi:hypothetical protein
LKSNQTEERKNGPAQNLELTQAFPAIPNLFLPDNLIEAEVKR